MEADGTNKLVLFKTAMYFFFQGRNELNSSRNLFSNNSNY